MKANERMRVRHQLDRRLSPPTAALSLDEYWWRLLDGKDADAKKVLADAAAEGLPLP